MLRNLVVTGLALVCLVPGAGAQDKGKFSVKSTDTAPPKELSAKIRDLLQPEALQFIDSAGKPVAEIWLRKQIPTDATAEQLKNGATYRELKQSEVLGAIRFERDWSDYRKQKIRAVNGALA
jgi:hypothetical protein